MYGFEMLVFLDEGGEDFVFMYIDMEQINNFIVILGQVGVKFVGEESNGFFLIFFYYFRSLFMDVFVGFNSSRVEFGGNYGFFEVF